MGKKRTAAEARDGPTKPVRKHDKKQQPPKGQQDLRPPKDGEQQSKNSLIFQPRPDWHAQTLPELPLVEDPAHPARSSLDALHRYADSLLQADNKEYEAKHMSSSSHKFMSTIMSSGTMEDRVSALTLVIQESPIHTTKAFESLFSMAKRMTGTRTHSLKALQALKDLLGQGVVLPPERKLRAFSKQPSLICALQGKPAEWKEGDKLPGKLERVHLVSWAYEDWLKKTYFQVLQVLEKWSHDQIDYARSQAVTYIWELLKEKPEQEDNLLRLLLNKLGDTEKKIASRASHLILQLQNTHPLMKGVIIKGIESDVLFHHGQTNHAKYYAIITLNQTILSTREPDVADKLLEIYFALFLTLLKERDTRKDLKNTANRRTKKVARKLSKKAQKKERIKEQAQRVDEDLEEKMIAQILTGVNRAYPFARTDDSKFENQLDTIFKVTHSSNFSTSVQALMLIQHICASKMNHSLTDRFFRVLYESLLDPRLITSSKQIMYLNLLYRSLKNDLNVKRVQAFVKRLLQIITLHEPPFITGVLHLIGELQSTVPAIRTMLNSPEENEDEERFVDAPEDGVDGEGEHPNSGEVAPQSLKTPYEGRKRDPLYANADRTCLWELTPFQSHFHPTVSLFASRLLYSEEMPPKPDPTLHTLMHFLDRFAYRRPRTKAAAKGTSIMQPLAGTPTADMLIKNRAGPSTDMSVNTEEFRMKNASDVPVDEVFFHRYFEQAGKRKGKKQKKKDKRIEDESDEAGEDEIWKALVQSKPEIEGEDEDDDGWDSEMENMMIEGEDEMDADGVNGEEEVEEPPDAENAEDGFGFDSEEEAFLDSEAELPSDLEHALKEDAKGKNGDESKEKKGRKRRKLKHLPTFASADDYAALLANEEDGM